MHLRTCGLLGSVGLLPISQRGARLRHKWFGNLSAYEFELLSRRIVGLNRPLALEPLPGIQLVHGIGCLLPPRGAVFGLFRKLFEGGYLGTHEPRRAVIDQPAHGLGCLLGGVGEATVGAVAFHRLDELLPRIGEVIGDDVESVLALAPGHADVDSRAAHRIGEDRVRYRHRHPLHPVGGGGIGQVRMLGNIPGGKPHRVLTLTVVLCFDRPDGAVVLDVLHDPLLPVRDPEAGVVLPRLNQITPPHR